MFKINLRKIKTTHNWGNIFLNHIDEKRLVPRIHKEMSKLNIKIQTTLFFKAGKTYEQTLHQRIKMESKHVKRGSMSLVTGEIQ